LSGVTGPAVQGLISRGVGANEQGGVQGSLTSLASVAGIIGPPIATGLFGHFIRPTTAVHLPGAAFFFSAGLNVAAMFLAMRSFRRNGFNPATPSDKAAPAAPR
jgi:DHA1 family tetracycline resistance protein-like MFS transporter